MLTKDDIEGFLDPARREGASYSEVEPGFWIVRPSARQRSRRRRQLLAAGRAPARQGHDAPVRRRTQRRRSTAGCSSSTRHDLCTGRTASRTNTIVLTEALELRHLDYEEFLAAYESMTLALASHLRELGSYREAR